MVEPLDKIRSLNQEGQHYVMFDRKIKYDHSI